MDDRGVVRTLSLDDEATVAVVGGSLQWVPVRQRLGVRAFGTNAYVADAGQDVVEDHDESSGHEEMYVVVRGVARFTVGDEELDATAPTVVFLPEPSVRRKAVALEDGTLVLAVGGWPERPYHPMPWEPIFLAHEQLAAQDWAAAVRVIESAADDRQRASFPVRFRLAACFARLGEDDRALAELRAAADDDAGRLRELTADDDAFSALRVHPDWPL